MRLNKNTGISFLKLFCSIYILSLFSTFPIAASESSAPSEKVIDPNIMTEKLKDFVGKHFKTHKDDETHVLYGVPVYWIKTIANKNYDPKRIKQGLVSMYGTGFCDTALQGGQFLFALCEAYEEKKDPLIGQWARELFQGMKLIGSVSPVAGFIPRGPHPNDRTCYTKDSSMDQHTTYVIALWKYYHSPIASKEDKEFIRTSISKVAERLEKNKWCILVEDDSKAAYAGGYVGGDTNKHSSILMPIIAAAYDVTGNNHWKKVYEQFSLKNDSVKWKNMTPDKIKLNTNMQWAYQLCYRMEAWYLMEDDVRRKQIIKRAISKAAEIMMAKKFPDEWTQKNNLTIKLTPEKMKLYSWKTDIMKSPYVAWSKFKPDLQSHPKSERQMMDIYCTFIPLGQFIMALYSRDDAMVNAVAPYVYDMLNTLEYRGLYGHSQWLMGIAGLKLYSLYYSGKIKKRF
jgi:hypothetical protein